MKPIHVGNHALNTLMQTHEGYEQYSLGILRTPFLQIENSYAVLVRYDDKFNNLDSYL